MYCYIYVKKITKKKIFTKKVNHGGKFAYYFSPKTQKIIFLYFYALFYICRWFITVFNRWTSTYHYFFSSLMITVICKCKYVWLLHIYIYICLLHGVFLLWSKGVHNPLILILRDRRFSKYAEVLFVFVFRSLPPSNFKQKKTVEYP